MPSASLGRPVHVVSTKYDGSPHWEFDSYFVAERGPLLIATNFAGQVLHNKAGPWETPFDVRNHFWTDRWYNVMRCDRSQAGGLEYWYCNVATPVEYDGATVRYADLDLDVRIFPDGTVEVLDEDEFLDNSVSMGYPPEVMEHARRAVDELAALAYEAQFPFEELAESRT